MIIPYDSNTTWSVRRVNCNPEPLKIGFFVDFSADAAYFQTNMHAAKCHLISKWYFWNPSAVPLLLRPPARNYLMFLLQG